MADRAGRLASTAGYGATLVIGLLGGLAVAVAAARPWVEASAIVAGLPEVDVSVSGSTLRPLAGAFGLVLLASFGSVIATRGVVRRSIGTLVVLLAVVVLVAVVWPIEGGDAIEDALSAKGWAGEDYTVSSLAWRWLAAVGALASGLAGALVVVHGGQWPTMGRRYDAPAADAEADTDAGAESGAESGQGESGLDEAALWRQLDRGHDPTSEG